MNRILLTIWCVWGIGLCFCPAAESAAEGQQELASETRSIFATKCAGCHGAALARPKGRFGFVLDLARVAANPEMVIPSYPEESELWELVRRGEMPPDDSPTGPLSEAEKEVIRSWIAAGAPANLPETTFAALTPGPEKGLLLSVRFCVLLGTVSVLITAALGWIHAGSGRGGGAREPRLAAHRRAPLGFDELGTIKPLSFAQLWSNALALFSLAALIGMIACLAAIR